MTIYVPAAIKRVNNKLCFTYVEVILQWLDGVMKILKFLYYVK